MEVSKETKTRKKTETVKIRIEPSERGLIDLAANQSGLTRSAFILDAARRAAQEVLLEQTVFALSPEQWEAFNDALDNPPLQNEKLAKLLAAKTPW